MTDLASGKQKQQQKRNEHAHLRKTPFLPWSQAQLRSKHLPFSEVTSGMAGRGGGVCIQDVAVSLCLSFILTLSCALLCVSHELQSLSGISALSLIRQVLQGVPALPWSTSSCVLLALFVPSSACPVFSPLLQLFFPEVPPACCAATQEAQLELDVSDMGHPCPLPMEANPAASPTARTLPWTLGTKSWRGSCRKACAGVYCPSCVHAWWHCA